MKKVKCKIKQQGTNISIRKIYEVLVEKEDKFTIKDDAGNIADYPREYFEIQPDKMRTIKEIAAIDPEARFSCGDVEFGVFPAEAILEQIGYCDEKPVVTYCKPNYFKMDARDILSREEESWSDSYQDWTLEVSAELTNKLQAVLDEIAEENRAANISYSEGEELDISEEWLKINGEENE